MELIFFLLPSLRFLFSLSLFAFFPSYFISLFLAFLLFVLYYISLAFLIPRAFRVRPSVRPSIRPSARPFICPFSKSVICPEIVSKLSGI